MADRSLSKLLSLVLRHEPGVISVTLDDAGWIGVETLLAALARHGSPIDRATLERIVREDGKQRYALSPDGLRIRASQGHSLDVALGYVATAPPELLYHGTVERFLASIRSEGLRR